MTFEDNNKHLNCNKKSETKSDLKLSEKNIKNKKQ
jgi:hypothetical protein